METGHLGYPGAPAGARARWGVGTGARARWGVGVGAVAVALLVTLACSRGAEARPGGAAQPATDRQDAGDGPARSQPAAAARSQPAAAARPVELEKVTLAASAQSLSHLPQLLAKTLGFYESEGLDVQIVTTRSDMQVAGMVSGELHYTTTAGDPIILAVAEGAPLNSILLAFDSAHFTLLGQPGLDRRQLKGARIGVSRLMSASHLDARAMVSHLGLDPENDVIFFSTGETSTSFAALEAGNIDAAVLSPPFSSELLSKGYTALARSSDRAERVPFTGLAAGTEHLRKNPAQAVKMSRAVLKSLELIVHDKPRLLELLIKDWEVDPAAADAAYDEMTRPLRPDGRVTDEAIQQHMDRLYEDTRISRPLKVSDVYDFSYLRQAAGTR
jgi:ABC-type nitrate/sulfonate/bicarbonate transport system substrate-binding protein